MLIVLLIDLILIAVAVVVVVVVVDVLFNLVVSQIIRKLKKMKM